MTNQRFSAPTALIAALSAGLLLTGCGLLRPDMPEDPEAARTGGPDASPTEAVQSPEPSEAPPVSDDHEAPGPDTDPNWLPPSFATGWTIDYHAEDNMHQAVLDGTGCDVLFSKHNGAEQGRQNGHDPAETVDAMLELIGENAGSAPVEEPATPFTIMADSGERFEFETKQATFDTSDGNHTVRAGAQWIDDSELLISSSCPTDVWDDEQVQIALLVGATSISDA